MAVIYKCKWLSYTLFETPNDKLIVVFMLGFEAIVLLGQRGLENDVKAILI